MAGMVEISKHMHIPMWGYKIMLLLAAAIWGMGTVVIKDTVGAFPPFWLVGIRFTAAGLLLAAIFLPRVIRNFTPSHLATGAFLGVLLAAAYCCNTIGLTDTTASKSSFLTAMYCVCVPFIAWAISRQRPTFFNIAAAILCIAGIWFVSQQGGDSLTLSFGDGITILSAFLLGLHMAFVAKFADGRDMAALTVIQFVVAGLIALFIAAFTEPAPTAELFTPDTISNIVYLVVFASCAALLLQNVGLTRVPAAPASLLLATESVFGVIFSIVVLGDTLNAHLMIGFLLIGCGILVSEALPSIKLHLSKRKR